MKNRFLLPLLPIITLSAPSYSYDGKKWETMNLSDRQTAFENIDENALPFISEMIRYFSQKGWSPAFEVIYNFEGAFDAYRAFASKNADVAFHTALVYAPLSDAVKIYKTKSILQHLENEGNALYYFLLAAHLGHEGAKTLLKNFVEKELSNTGKKRAIDAFLDSIFNNKKGRMSAKASKRREEFRALWISLIKPNAEQPVFEE